MDASGKLSAHERQLLLVLLMPGKIKDTKRTTESTPIEHVWNFASRATSWAALAPPEDGWFFSGDLYAYPRKYAPAKTPRTAEELHIYAHTWSHEQYASPLPRTSVAKVRKALEQRGLIECKQFSRTHKGRLERKYAVRLRPLPADAYTPTPDDLAAFAKVYLAVYKAGMLEVFRNSHYALQTCMLREEWCARFQRALTGYSGRESVHQFARTHRALFFDYLEHPERDWSPYQAALPESLTGVERTAWISHMLLHQETVGPSKMLSEEDKRKLQARVRAYLHDRERITRPGVVARVVLDEDEDL